MWEILQYPFFQNALLGSLLASILCAIVGTYIVSRRLVFISGGIKLARICGFLQKRHFAEYTKRIPNTDLWYFIIYNFTVI